MVKIKTYRKTNKTEGDADRTSNIRPNITKTIWSKHRSQLGRRCLSGKTHNITPKTQLRDGAHQVFGAFDGLQLVPLQ